MEQLETVDAGPHVAQVRHELAELVAHLRTDSAKLRDPQAAALFEAAADVLTGVERAFEHFESESEPGSD